MQTSRNFMVVPAFVGIFGSLCLTLAYSAAQETDSTPFNAVISIGKTGESAKLGISPVDFETRWGADEDDLAVDASGVIRPHRLLTVDETVTGSIPVPPAKSTSSPYKSKYESIVKGVSGSNPDSPECGPSPLTEAEIRDLVVSEAEAANVDVGFALAITKAESNFDRIRNSPKGARGPMQLMPATAADYGVRDICDPEDNIRGGIAHLRLLFDELANPLLVAAAYNAGQGRIAEYGGIPPFEETLNYVAKVINYQLGLDPPPLRPAVRRGERLTANRADEPVHPSASGVTRPAKGEWTAGVLQF